MTPKKEKTETPVSTLPTVANEEARLKAELDAHKAALLKVNNESTYWFNAYRQLQAIHSKLLAAVKP